MSKSRGTARERAVKDYLAKRDWIAFRAPGSLGAADVIALQPNRRPLCVRVKSDVRSPYKNFSPAEREALLQLAALAGGEAWLVCHPLHGEMRWIHAREWPGSSLKADA